MQSQLLEQHGISAASVEGVLTAEHAAEVARYGAGELHAVAAQVGGIASQEAVKLITRQYIPLDNTFLLNCISGTAATFRL